MDWTPSLKWRRTWPGRQYPLGSEDDYTASPDDRPHAYCRIYRVICGPQDGRWLWTAAEYRQLGSGYEKTPRLAAAAAERALFAARR